MLTTVEDARQVGVLNTGRTNDATTEVATNFFVQFKVLGQALHHDLALQGVVVGEVDLGGVAHTNDLENPKPVSKNVARRK